MNEKQKSFEYTHENLRKLQLVENEMLKELDRICRINNINYIIDAGTLLGAVRHGGFIPWDDDIDVRMLRKDYDKFCEICSKQLNHKYFLQTYKTDKNYLWGYARILKNGTVYMRKNHSELKSKNGIFIDIFPNDNIPENGFGYKYCTLLSWIGRKILYSELGRKYSKGFFCKLGYSCLNMLPKRLAHICFEHLTEKYKNIKTDKVRCWGWGSCEETLCFRKEWLEHTKDIQFEGMNVRAPVKTHEFLVHSFGPDYMIPPPKNERVPRHIADYIKF